MAKSRKLKKGTTDAVNARRAAKKVNPFANGLQNIKKINPFEVHMNKEKFNILGRTCKHDKGLPGVSRAKANNKRKETLEKEYRLQHKNNQFRDRRIGKHLTGDELNEEVMNARFLAEKMSQMKPGKSSRFNLNEDEMLTHRGQTLEDIEQFHDDRSDDEDDNDNLDADFTEAAHFGGESNDVKDRKAAIDEMIVEQKRKKLEIAKEKDEVQNLTDKLDSNYKQLMSLMGKMTKDEENVKLPPDDYDKKVREMIFEPRGVVTDKLLSEEELVKKEKERLEEFEQQRLRRMRGEDEVEEVAQKPNHRSADDLDDSYFAYEPVEETATLTYNLDGELHNGDTEKRANEEDEEDEKEQEDEEEDDEENESEEEEDDDDDNDNDEEEDDNLSDLKVTESDSEDEKAPKKPQNTEKVEKKSLNKILAPASHLPFVIEMPKTYEQFNTLLEKHSTEDQGVLLERLIKCNHPKLEAANREKVCKLFAFLLEYIDDKFSNASIDNIRDQFKLLSIFNVHMYDLLQMQPDKMSIMLLNVIKQKHEDYKKNVKSYPNLETVIFFKLVSNYCSTSDFRHPVVTPTYVFISQILSQARVRTRQDIALGLFLVTIITECTQKSQRFLPAALNFLLGVVYLSIPKTLIVTLKIVPPFQSTGVLSKLLAIASDDEEAKNVPAELLKSEDLLSTHIDVDFKVRALNTTLELIGDNMRIVKGKTGANYLALPFLNMFERLSLDVYPEYVKKNFEFTKEILEEVGKSSLKKLTAPDKKPKALRLLEPRIETVYNDKRRPKLSEAKEERVKLQHKVKRETKGAIREIRRDTQFLQKIRIQEQIQSDLERKEKVKRIYQEASLQQGELKEFDRAKKRKKF